MSSAFGKHTSSRPLWGLLLLITSLVFGLALLPPLLTPEWRPLLMHAFSPVCHQIPVRSPFIDGVQIAVCDRCVGIYLGLVLGVGTVAGTRKIWARLGRHSRFLFLGSLVPLGVDWIGPALGLWGNAPVSRALTGLVFGVIAASFVTHRLLRRSDRSTDRGS